VSRTAQRRTSSSGNAAGTGAADRLPRLLALVPYLLANPGVSTREVCAVFGVTERQLRADLDLLFLCGLPGHSPGDLIDVNYHGDRITLSNADELARPLRLTADEALALVVALRTLADVPGVAERDALDRVLAKLENAVAAPGPVAADRVVVSVEAEADVLALVRRGLDEGRRLHLRYLVAARDETTERDVDPMRLLLVEGRSYLEAWCRRAEGVRLFRLDRMVGVEVLDVAAEPPPEAQPRDLADGLFQPAPTDAAITLELAPAARWVADYYPCEEVTEAADGMLTVRLRTTEPSWVVRLCLRLGPAGRVVEPVELATAVREAARRALAAYGETG
jgi:proteasome accessory factor C